MKDINKIITLLDASVVIGADVTLTREDALVLLDALVPIIKTRAEYWQSLHERCTACSYGERRE